MLVENGDSSEACEKSETKNGMKTSESLLHEEVLDALMKEAERRGLSECKLDISSGSEKGDNYMGIIAKVKVTGKNAEGEEVQWNWIAKAAPQTDLYRTLLKVDIAYGREVYMYKLFDRFDEFQMKKKLLHPFNAHPKFILSYLEPYKESFVMEDLKAIGYVLRDRKQPLDQNHVKLVMKEYGRLHALSFALRDQKPEEFERLAKETEDKHFVETDEEKLKEAVKHQDTFNARLLGAMDEEKDADAIESLKWYCKDSIRINMDSIKTTSQYSVIGHGDCWANNLLWKYEDSENAKIPTQVCLLDWQLARYGSPAQDLSYFIYACTDQKFREEHYDRMIKLYYYTLCANLVEMGSNPEKLFPYTALEAELKRYCIFGFFISTMVVQFMLSETNEVPELGKSDNMDQLVDSLQYKSVNHRLVEERIHGIILHMHQKGYFDFLKPQ